MADALLPRVPVWTVYGLVSHCSLMPGTLTV